MTLPSLYIYEVSVFAKLNLHLFDTLRSKRHQHKIKSMKLNTALLRNNIFGMIPKIYNHLPNSILQEQNIGTFKNNLKKLLLSKCYYRVDKFLNDKLM